MQIPLLRRVVLFTIPLFLSVSLTGSIVAQGIDFPSDSILVCVDAPITLTAESAQAYTWTPGQDFDDPSAQTVVLTPSATQWYFLESQINDSTSVLDSIFVELIDPTFSLTLSTTDSICPETPVIVEFSSSHPITSVSWNIEEGVDDPTSTTGTIVRPLRTTQYIVTAIIGTCERSDTFRLLTPILELDLITDDTIFICKPDTAVIRTGVEPPDLTVTWTPLNGTIDVIAGSRNARVYPSVTSVYTATVSLEGCTLNRETVVRVDSLPDLEPLSALPFKDPYCSGDTLWIIGPAVDTALYPDIEWTWMPMDGQIVGPETPGTTGNVRISIRDTTTWFRIAEQNACLDTTQITLNAIPPDIPLSVNDTMLCPGETFVVEVLDRDVEDLEWMPETGLSCTDCFEPEVTVQSMPITYTVMGMKEGCPVGGQLVVNPLPFLPIPVSPPAFGCEGDQIQLNIDDTGITNVRVVVTAGEGVLSCNECTNPILTINGSGTIVIEGDTDSTACGARAVISYGIGPREEPTFAEFVCVDEPTVVDLTRYGFVNPVIDENGIADCNGLQCVVTIGPAGGSIFVDSDDYQPGFCEKRTEIQFLPLPLDAAQIVALDSTGFAQGETITVELQPPGPDGTVYQWFVDNVEQDDTGNPAMITFLTTGVMQTVTVIWTNSQGCRQVANVTYPIEEANIQFPNAFTPNGDGDNDMFRAREQGPSELDVLLVFNRWGQVVYEGGDPDGWDGNFDGEPAPPEVYVYLAKYRFPNGDIREFKGDVTLIR